MEKRKRQIFTCLVGADTPQEIMTLWSVTRDM